VLRKLTLLFLACSAPAQEIDTILRHVLPKADELAWQSIRWRPTLWGAVVEAQAERKPILLWAMNGHPLGLT
jgi:hypothetical protein